MRQALKRFMKSRGLQVFLGHVFSSYLRFVKATSRRVTDRQDTRAYIFDNLPFITTFWHGEHFVTPFELQDGVDVTVMISKSGDGEINTVAVQDLGFGVVRGSGANDRQTGERVLKRGGITGLKNLLSLVRKPNQVVAMTGDVPKGPAKQAGMGLVTLARLSGRPIIPLGAATSRFIRLKTWDSMVINLPFSRLGICWGEPIHIPRNLTEDEQEHWRRVVEDELNRVTRKAYELAGRDWHV
ncbi:lysophospholipid acyltransferase family protein [Coralliovum pocilloporae]|uniref:lysophospholipid acyltransferase family protein n=1 Tax=Coralliovum pocilloporae TaxID=3066369 RepID=UPI003306B09C